MKRVAVGAILMLFISQNVFTQTKLLDLQEAVRLGIQNSKQLKLSAYKIEAALNQVQQAREASLPTAKASAGYSHALMLSRNLTFPSSDGQDPKSLKLPFDNSVYQASVSLNQPIYAANKFRYARQSADLLVKMSNLDAAKNMDDIVYTVISAYINYYSILQNQQVIARNLDDVENKLEEIKKFESQGLATRNDVLRYQLQHSEIELQAADMENNRRIANYSMNVLLGLPDSTQLHIEAISYKLDGGITFENYLGQAIQHRKEFASLHISEQMTDIDIKKIEAERMPNVGLGANLYYFNLSKSILPKTGDFLVPFLLGVNLSWDIGSLYKTKTRIAEVNNQKQQVQASVELVTDRVKTEVYRAYYQYQQAMERIKVLQSAVEEATENERITESKYKNNLASTTERIDAQTLLYQSRINLELAKAQATQSYYDLLMVTGQVKP